MDEHEFSKKRLAWACRRGMLELDLILLPFLEACYVHLTPTEQQAFQQLLECTDQELYSYFIKQQPPEDVQLQDIINKVMQHVHA